MEVFKEVLRRVEMVNIIESGGQLKGSHDTPGRNIDYTTPNTFPF